MMKKYIYQILCSLFIGGAMVSCAEDYMETDKGHDTLTLTVNQQYPVMSQVVNGITPSPAERITGI